MPQSRSAPRILQLVNDLHLGGAQRMVCVQAAALHRAGHAVEVASLELVAGGPVAAEIEAAGVRVHRLRGSGEPALLALARLPGLLRALAPDLVHTHLAAAGVAGRLAARRARVPRVVTTLHNLSDWQERRAHPLRLLDRRTLPLADSVVAVSDVVRAAFVRACPRLAPRAVTIRNGVELAALARTRGLRARAREAFGATPGEFVAVAVARLDRRKGLDVLVEALRLAAARAPGLRLIVAGDGPERAALDALARARGVAPLVRWLGFQADVRPCLAAADVFVAPSRTEGLGVAAIEALAAGVPVLAARAGGLPEVLEGAECGLLLPPDAPADWASALVALAGDPAALARMARAAPARAARFSANLSVHELEGLYDGLLGAAPPAREAAA